MTLSRNQQHALGMLCSSDYALPVRDVGEGLRIPRSTAERALRALEDKGLVKARYTGVAGRWRHYEPTSEGQRVNESLWDED